MPIQLLITDLDNTLYDWVSSFVPALYAMVEVASQRLNVPLDELLTQLKAVHQRHRNSEHQFALLETGAVQSQFAGLSLDEMKEQLKPAFHAFDEIRTQSLKLYPGVAETLATVRGTGAFVVAHTDAHARNSLSRIVRLGLVEFICRLYAPENSDVRTIDAYPDMAVDFLRRLPLEDRKPNPKVLLDICRDYEVVPENALYVGDSLVRDVFMARRAGAKSALASYGSSYDRELWNKLVRVTHWTDEDVQRETELRASAADILADVELNAFSEILTHFSFCAGRGSAP